MPFTYQPRKGLDVYLRCRNEQKSRNGLGPDSVQYVLLSQWRQNWRLPIEYQLNKVFGFKARTRLVRFSSEAGPQEDGFSAFIEGVWRQGTILSANLRLLYFSTDSYNSRIYACESDLLYHFYIPAVFNRGVRYYLSTNLDAGKKVSFWLRWAQTLYSNQDVISSGMEEIEGKTKSEVKAQQRLILCQDPCQ